MSLLDDAKSDFKHLMAKHDSFTFDRIIFGSKPSEELQFLATFNSPDGLHERLARGPIHAIEKKAKLDADNLVEFRKYQLGALQSHQVYVFDPDEDASVKAFLDAVRTPGSAQSAFDIEEIPWSHIHFEARIIRVGNEKAAFLRKTTSGNIIARSKKMRLLVRDGSLESAESPIVLLDDDVDGVYWRKRLFILRTGAMETLLGFEEDVEEAVEMIAAQLNKSIPISGLSDLVAAASRHWQMAKKLQKVAQRDYIASITIDDVKRVAAKANLKVDFKTVDGKEHVVYATSDKWSLLRILDDDYVTGELTRRLYESTSKSEV